MIENPQYDRATCYFCLSEETQILEEHHIVPQRFDGSDDAENMVRVCPTCHRKLEQLYNNRYYEELGVEQPRSEGGDNTTTRIPSNDDYPTLIHLIEDIKVAYDFPAGVPVDVVMGRANSEFEASRDRIENEIEKFREKGELFMPERNKIQTTCNERHGCDEE